MAITAYASWLVASQSKAKRESGFWWFLGGNVLWFAWGVHDGAYALIALQICLAALTSALRARTRRPRRTAVTMTEWRRHGRQR